MPTVRCFLFVFLLTFPTLAQDGVQVWVKELLAKKDDAELALIEKISGVRSREAALGLVEAYDTLQTLLYRREVIRGLHQYANLAEAEQPALEKLANIAGNPETDADLRDFAIQGLGKSNGLGRTFLQRLVDCEIADAVREAALREHVKGAVAADGAWYRHLWNYKQEQRKDKKGEIAPPEFNTVRQLAVQGLLQFLSENEIVETLKRETDPKIRRALLANMRQKQMPRTAEIAKEVLESVVLPGVERAEAARILCEKDGAKVVNTFCDLAKKRDVTTEDLRVTMAALIAGLGDEAVDKRMVKLIGKGKPHEKVFALLATEKVMDPKVVAAIRKGLQDDAPEVRRATAHVLGSRRDRESLPELRKLLGGKVPGDARLALDAITAIEGFASAWLKELVAYTTHADRELRNAAVGVIGASRDKRQTGVVLAALVHDDWSTRLVAIEALEQIKDKDSVGKLVDRLAQETGRLRKRVAEALWNLTAQPFDEDAAKWTAWWKEAAATFAVATEKELDKAIAERERRRLTARTTTGAKFFGLEVQSQRVIFVFDVSGSMLESMYGRYVGKRGAARIDVAKQELVQAIKNLEAGTLFNIFAFSTGVARWQKDGIGVNTAPSRQESLDWIERLGASGATNLYDALKQAFDDRDVDTIFLMSDGEPTNGEVIDPHRIREDVALWNKHRKIKINSIAIGGNLEILEWLAKDAGGTYVQMR